MPNQPKPALPAYSPTAIRALARKLTVQVAAGYDYAELRGNALDGFVAAFRAVVEGVPYSVAYETCRPLVGKILRRDVVETWAYRIAANRALLLEGTPVLPWTTQAGDEWVPVQVLDGVPDMDRWNHPGMRYTIAFLAGSPAALHGTRFWTREQASFLSGHLGFTRSFSKKALKFGHSSQLVGLQFYAFVEARLSKDSPTFEKVDVSQSMRVRNKDLLRRRLRPEGGPCEPMKFDWACHHCAVGRDRCDLAVHARTYESRFCNECGNEAAFDPTVTDQCVACTIKERFKDQRVVNDSRKKAT